MAFLQRQLLAHAILTNRIRLVCSLDDWRDHLAGGDPPHELHLVGDQVVRPQVLEQRAYREIQRSGNQHDLASGAPGFLDQLSRLGENRGPEQILEHLLGQGEQSILGEPGVISIKELVERLPIDQIQSEKDRDRSNRPERSAGDAAQRSTVHRVVAVGMDDIGFHQRPVHVIESGLGKASVGGHHSYTQPCR